MASFIFNTECLWNEMLRRKIRPHLVHWARRLELYFCNQNQNEYILYKFNLLGNKMQLWVLVVRQKHTIIYYSHQSNELHCPATSLKSVYRQNFYSLFKSWFQLNYYNQNVWTEAQTLNFIRISYTWWKDFFSHNWTLLSSSSSNNTKNQHYISHNVILCY